MLRYKGHDVLSKFDTWFTTLLGFNLWSGPWLVQHGCKPCKTRIEPWNVGILEAGVASLRECWSFEWNLNIGLTHLIVTVCISISLFVCVSPCLPIRPALSRFLCIYLSVCGSVSLPAFQPSCLSFLALCVCLCLCSPLSVYLNKHRDKQIDLFTPFC